MSVVNAGFWFYDDDFGTTSLKLSWVYQNYHEQFHQDLFSYFQMHSECCRRIILNYPHFYTYTAIDNYTNLYFSETFL